MSLNCILQNKYVIKDEKMLHTEDSMKDRKYSAKGDAFAYLLHIFMILYLSTLIQIIACKKTHSTVAVVSV